MRAAAPFLVVLVVLGGAWLRGPLPSGARATVDAFRQDASGVTSSAGRDTQPTAPYITTPQPGLTAGLVLAPGETVRVLTVEQWRAIQGAFPENEQWVAARTMFCESGGDAGMHIIDSDGLPRAGAWSVGARWWGPVPPTLAGQAQQTSQIVARVGWAPFTASSGCGEWSR